MQIINKGLGLPDLEKYIESLVFNAWKPSLIVIHHTAAPSLADRPTGFTSQHMINIKNFYEGQKPVAWSAGPHLFVDDKQVWLFSPMTAPGVHAVSFNKTAIGIEMLGNYDTEHPWSGRGLQVLENTCKATALLLKKLGLTPMAIRFHRDDPKTKKTCPGTKISKDAFLTLLNKYFLK